jgi:hypothetical protein
VSFIYSSLGNWIAGLTPSGFTFRLESRRGLRIVTVKIDEEINRGWPESGNMKALRGNDGAPLTKRALDNKTSVRADLDLGDLFGSPRQNLSRQ